VLGAGLAGVGCCLHECRRAPGGRTGVLSTAAPLCSAALHSLVGLGALLPSPTCRRHTVYLETEAWVSNLKQKMVRLFRVSYYPCPVTVQFATLALL